MRIVVRAAAFSMALSLSLTPILVAAQTTPQSVTGPVPYNTYDQNITGLSGEGTADLLTVYYRPLATPTIAPTTAGGSSFWDVFTRNAPCTGYGCTGQQSVFGPSTVQYPYQQQLSTNNATFDLGAQGGRTSGYCDPATDPSCYGPLQQQQIPSTGGQGWNGSEPSGGSLPPPTGGGGSTGGAIGSTVGGTAGSVVAGSLLSSVMSRKADVMCKVVQVNRVCPPCSLFVPGPTAATYTCKPASNQYMCPGSCWDLTSGITIPGVCVKPEVCKAVGLPTGGGGVGGFLSGLGDKLTTAIIMQAVGIGVGKLLNSTGSGTGAGTGGAGTGTGGYTNPYPTNTTPQCTTYTNVTDPTLASLPCTRLVPGNGTGTGTGTGTTGTNASVSVAPDSGRAPLRVTLTVTDTSLGCPRDAIALNFGDSASDTTVFSPTTVCSTRAPATISHTYTAAGSYVAHAKNGTSGAEFSTATISVQSSVGTTTSATSTTDTTNVTLVSSPSNGPAPLSVALTIADISPTCPHMPVGLIYGDGSDPSVVFDGVNSCGQPAQHLTHVYQNPGAYRIVLVKHDRTVLRTSNVIVNGSAQTTFDTSNTSGINTTNIQFSGNQASLMPPGPTGEIKVFGSGITAYGTMHDAASNTTVTGFYGSNTFSGDQGGTTARLCISRPWSTNFLSKIVPPSFFDSLCSSRGYQVGARVPAPAVPTPPRRQVQLTQTQPAPAVKTPITPVVKSATTTPLVVAPVLPSKVSIWAVPATVTLGSRTTVYWRVENVDSCTISSPDGSFTRTFTYSDKTKSGGGNTVPLTSATTFTISCLSADGGHATAAFTVNLAI